MLEANVGEAHFQHLTDDTLLLGNLRLHPNPLPSPKSLSVCYPGMKSKPTALFRHTGRKNTSTKAAL